MRFLLALLLSVGLASNAGAEPDKEQRDRSSTDTARTASARTSASSRPDPGSCEIGRSNGTLNVNQVQATVFTTGTLFYGPGGAAEYYVPQQSRLSPVYASSVWIAGRVGGELRVAGATYGQGGVNNDYFEFWPGPLNDDGSLPDPNDCSQFDRIYVVSRQDIRDYEAGGAPVDDLAEWPAELGAPVIDGDGDEDNYNLAGGDRPDIIGDQSLWYVLNDVGNLHRTTQSEPIGLEVRIQAFSFARDNALGQTTFYKYNILYKGDEPLTDAYLSVWSDPDLGNASDDFVGVDADISMGFVYNADPVDDGSYGTAPPALGYDFFQGPRVDIDEDGTIGDDERLGLTSFMYFVNGDANRGDPRNAEEFYNIMQGIWRDGTPMTAFGNGYNTAGDVTKFAFPGDPVTQAFWSEENNGAGRNVAADRRFVQSTGPFVINPGDEQEIVFGIVYGRGNSRLSSITALRAADVFAQSAYDLDFNLPVPAPAPSLCDSADNPTATRLPGSGRCFTASEEDGSLILSWGYAPTDPAFLGNYESQGYEFEGFNLYRYPNGQFNRDDRELVAVYDKVNDITTLQNIFFDPEVGDNVPELAAQGTNSGLAYSYIANNLTNYRDYYYGLSTYIVDPLAEQERVIESSPTFLTVRPSSIANANGGTEAQALPGQEIDIDFSQAFGSIEATARVIDPAQITGDNYEIRYTYVDEDDDDETPSQLAYRIVNTTTGTVLFDGAEVVANGDDLPFGTNVFAAEGIVFDVLFPGTGFESFQVVANASGVLDAPVPGAAAFAGFPTPGGENPGASQQANSDNDWFIGCARNIFGLGFCSNYTEFLANIATSAATPSDWEIRFPDDPQASFGGFAYGSTGTLSPVPFELWNIGIATPDDPSDDVRYFPVMLDLGRGNGERVFEMVNDEATALPYGLAGESPSLADSGISGAENDPVSDLFSWAAPRNGQTGEDGYNDWVNLWQTDPDAAVADARAIAFGAPTPFVLMSLVGWNLADVTTPGVADYRFTFPEPGTVFRMLTFKPIAEGDAISLSTQPFATTTATGFVQEDADRIGIVPNPYFGFSQYESGNTERVARFTNLPERATIRVFTISGTLIRTLTKDSNQRSFDWNLQTENGLPVASGLYLIHVELPDSGLERVIKFGVVNRQTQIEIL